MNIGTLFKSKTVWGGVFGIGAWLLSQPHLGTVEVVQAAGSLLSIIGVRDAIAKGVSRP